MCHFLPVYHLGIAFLGWVEGQNITQPRPGTTQKEAAELTAFNGSGIPLHGSIQIQCAYKGEWRRVKFYIVTPNGPTILGLPSLQDLKLVTRHCSIQRTKCAPVNHETNTPVTPPDNAPINSTKEQIEAYPDQFDRVGNLRRGVPHRTSTKQPFNNSCIQEMPHPYEGRSKGRTRRDYITRNNSENR